VIIWSNWFSIRLATGMLVRSEVFTAVTMKKAVFWDITPCGSCKNRSFGGIQLLHCQGDSSPIIVTLMMKALGSSETSILIRATLCNIPEDAFFKGMLHSKRLKII
jgi:hypothetical protein